MSENKKFQWQTPAWQTPIDGANRVELFSLPDRDMIGAKGWPETFWASVGDRIPLSGDEARDVIELFRRVEPGESARCHMPPWGIAFYGGEALLFTVTLCFVCSNAYVFQANGRDLRAFDPSGENAGALRRTLEKHLPLRE